MSYEVRALQIDSSITSCNGIWNHLYAIHRPKLKPYKYSIVTIATVIPYSHSIVEHQYLENITRSLPCAHAQGWDKVIGLFICRRCCESLLSTENDKFQDVGVMASSMCCQTIRNIEKMIFFGSKCSRQLEIVLFDRSCLLTTPSTALYAYMLFRLHMLKLNLGKGV